MTGIIHKVVVASDSFKGCLRSDQVAAAVAEGLQNALPGFHEIYQVIPESMPLHEAMNPETAGRNIIRTIEDVIAAIV